MARLELAEDGIGARSKEANRDGYFTSLA